MPLSSVYVGIDVACAVGKRLPICVVSASHPVMPLAIPQQLAGLIPRGVGNKEIAAAMPFHEAARGVVRTMNRIMDEMGWKIERIAVDAPAAPPESGTRASEDELARLGRGRDVQADETRTTVDGTGVEFRLRVLRRDAVGAPS